MHNTFVNDVGALVQAAQEASNKVEAGDLGYFYERKQDVRAHNKRMNALWALLGELAASHEGRLALESLLRDSPTTSLRIAVANVVMRWDGFSARDALEEIVSTGGGQVTRPMTMTAALQAPDGTARNAALSLLNLGRH